jgi:phenylalanyl-tRNA synthetase beta chain
MPVVTFDYNDFINILGYEISKKKLIQKLPMIGADLDKVENNEISIEFFPDRPDLASVEGIARASRSFFNFEKGLKKYPIAESDLIINVDSSVKKVRPFISTALVKNVDMTDELISSLMELQEKLHQGLGRNRKKVAIGVHNYEAISSPFNYKAVDPDSIQFVPLNKDESMTMTEILKKHEKGIIFSHLLENFNIHPLITDKYENVLSYPPIINGSLTEVTPFTKDLFIDVTGIERRAINFALNIVVTALAERGGKIFTTKIIDGEKIHISPNLNPVKKTISLDYINQILGTKLNDNEVIICLEKMGYDVKLLNKTEIEVNIPSWRADILHDIDIIEDVSIGYGFEKFKPDFPKALTFGKSLKIHDLFTIFRNILIGLGFNEITTFTISNEQDEFIKMGLKIGDRVQIKNPIGDEYSCLRTWLIPSLLKILNENRHHPLPQKIFELGDLVVDGYGNNNHLAFLKIDAKANFTECKSYAEAILRDFGVKYDLRSLNHPAFIKGRCAGIFQKNRGIGLFGEIHPKIIMNFQLEYPIIAFEIDLEIFNQ